MPLSLHLRCGFLIGMELIQLLFRKTSCFTYLTDGMVETMFAPVDLSMARGWVVDRRSPNSEARKNIGQVWECDETTIQVSFRNTLALIGNN